MRINLTTPMSDDKERERHTKAVIDAIEQYTEERMADEYGRIHTDGSRSGGQPVLLPCPCCETEAVFIPVSTTSDVRFRVKCCNDGCGLQTNTFASADVVVEVWNTRQPTQSDEWQAGYEAGVEAAAKGLEDDAKKCDCFARNEGECGCGAWCEWKSITSARAIELVRALRELG
jgi:hypothetical protein